MTLQLTFSDRMGTTNHDMECIRESFFPLQTLSTTLSSSSKFISLEICYKAVMLFR